MRSVILRDHEVRRLLDVGGVTVVREVKPEHLGGSGMPSDSAMRNAIEYGAGRRCPVGAPDERRWVRETFWAQNETCDHEYCGGCDLGSLLSLGEVYACPQYVATPECCRPPALQPAQTIAPHTGPCHYGQWWLAPPDGWDGERDYSSEGEWTFGPHNATKHSAAQMPRWASRAVVEVASVRVCRVRDLTVDDIEATGLIRDLKRHTTPLGGESGTGRYINRKGQPSFSTVDGCFALAWDEQRGATKYANDPWAWVASVSRVEAT